MVIKGALTLEVGLSHQFSEEYVQRLNEIHRALGIPGNYEKEYRVWMQQEAQALVSAGNDVFGREQFLIESVKKRWAVMRKTAQRDFVELSLVSCFRSVDYQQELIQKKLDDGQVIENILKVSAAPGHSEHHTGRAIDIGTSGCDHLSEDFDETVAFQWLEQNGEKFGFTMSYPKGNQSGVGYEPWHWACLMS